MCLGSLLLSLLLKTTNLLFAQNVRNFICYRHAIEKECQFTQKRTAASDEKVLNARVIQMKQ